MLLLCDHPASAVQSHSPFLLIFPSAFGYHLLVVFIRPAYSPSPPLVLLMACVIWGCSLFAYFFHTWLGLRFGRNVSFAMATVEILFSALMLTGLGDTIWFFIPSAWSIRLVSLILNYFLTDNTATAPSIKLGVMMVTLGTLLMLVFLFGWFRRWEGRKNEE